jgi:hypothetical protein
MLFALLLILLEIITHNALTAHFNCTAQSQLGTQ